MSETRAASTNAAEIDNSENIILGSGDLFIVEYSGTIPEDATIEADDNRAGNIRAARRWNIPPIVRPWRTTRGASRKPC